MEELASFFKLFVLVEACEVKLATEWSLSGRTPAFSMAGLATDSVLHNLCSLGLDALVVRHLLLEEADGKPRLPVLLSDSIPVDNRVQGALSSGIDSII